MPDRVFPISRVSPRGLWTFYLLTALVLAVPLAARSILVAWSLPLSFEVASTRPTFEVAPAGLTVRGSVYGLSVPTGSIETISVRRLRGFELRTYTPRSQSRRDGLPEPEIGWSTLLDGRKVLLFVTDWSNAVVVPTTDESVLVLSPSDPDAFVSMMQNLDPHDAIAPQVFSSAGLAAGGRLKRADLVFWLTLFGIPLAVLVLTVVFLINGRNVRFVLGDGSLRVRGDVYGRSIPRAALRPEGAEVIDLRAGGRYSRMLRVNGIGLPGYASGWFRPVGGGRALVFVTDRSRVVALPTTLGYTLLVSPADPSGFLAALSAAPARLEG